MKCLTRGEVLSPLIPQSPQEELISLRKSPELTPALLAAARNNAQHSTGPRSAAAKQNSKLNALKHGAYVGDNNRHKTMLALGEDPEQLQTLTEGSQKAEIRRQGLESEVR